MSKTIVRGRALALQVNTPNEYYPISRDKNAPLYGIKRTDVCTMCPPTTVRTHAATSLWRPVEYDAAGAVCGIRRCLLRIIPRPRGHEVEEETE
eukprot:2165148-Prymnesium_polylepis.1